jgi:GT2 family glycosyltransferase
MELKRNHGFAGAYNLGIRTAVSESANYVALLNNDTWVDPDWLAALVATAEGNPNVAICHSRQRTWDGRYDIHFKFIPEWVEAQVVKVPVQDPGPPAESIFATGCAMLLRCDALSKIGLFDERYFAYVEDIDLSMRAWITGYVVLLVPQSIVYHRVSGSSTINQRMFWGYRNELTTLLKLYQLETLRDFAEPIILRWFWTRNRIALRGTLGAIAMLPGTLARRTRIQRLRVQSDASFLALCNL